MNVNYWFEMTGKNMKVKHPEWPPCTTYGLMEWWTQKPLADLNIAGPILRISEHEPKYC